MRGSRRIRAIALLGVAGLLATGCLAQSGGSGNSGGANKNTSKKIEIMTGFAGPQFQNFKAAVEPYAKSQGITIKWTPAPNFNQLILTRVQGNNPPDIALFPQPGIMKQIAQRNKLVPLTGVVPQKNLDTLVTGMQEAGTYNGKLYAVVVSMNVKSLVFYPKAPFEKAGYTVPKTQADLVALTNKIRSQGKTPWCMGIESAQATGWPATDWIEDLILQQNGLDTYNQWVNHKIKFDSPTVKKAVAAYSQYAFTKGNVLGGRKSIATNTWNTAATPMFKSKPGCYLFKQGNFAAQPGGFPDSVIKNLDQKVGVFKFPPQTAGGSEQPILGGGDLAALFSGKNASAKKILTYMTTSSFGASDAKLGGYLQPHKDFDLSNYPNQINKDVAKIAYGSTAFAFDGSDQMPAAVGSGTFWKDSTAWISGQKSEEAMLKDIDSSWPAS